MRFAEGDVVEYTHRPLILDDMRRHPRMDGQTVALMREDRRRKRRGVVTSADPELAVIRIDWETGRVASYEDGDERIQEASDGEVEG